MATDFGFLPSNENGAYFISYNSEDGDRVGTIARELNALGLPMWYDYGLEYGDEWERQIAMHIKSCKAVIMFITKKLFLREKRSYVYKEYRMAKMCGTKVYVVMMDNISDKDVPEDLWGWWIDLTDLHCITNATAQGIMSALGFASRTPDYSSCLTEMGAEDLWDKGCDYYCEGNFVEAAKCYRIAAEDGHPEAQYCLGLCYRDGEGVPQNYAEAIRYCRMAAEQGLEEAKQTLKELYTR